MQSQWEKAQAAWRNNESLKKFREKSKEISKKVVEGAKTNVSHAPGTLSLWYKKGKHTMLTNMKSVDPIRDAAYDEKHVATQRTNKILDSIQKEFEHVTDSLAALSKHYENLCDLLEEFRLACDDEISHVSSSDIEVEYVESSDSDVEGLYLPTRSSTALPMEEDAGSSSSSSKRVHSSHREKGEEEGGQGEDHHATASSPSQQRDEGSTETSSSYPGSKAHRQRKSRSSSSSSKPAPPPHTAEDRQIHDSGKKIQALVAELHETVKNSCHSISVQTGETLKAESRAIHDAVTNQRLEFDMKRIELQELEASLHKAQGRSEHSKHDQESGGVVAAFADPKLGAAVQIEERDVEELYKTKKREVVEKAGVYKTLSSHSKKRLHYLLEQTSMATWSCYNIFFTQMTSFLRESATACESVARAFLSLKNSQCVAKAISKEKRDRLALADTPPSETLTGAVTAASSSASSSAARGPSSHADPTAVSFFDTTEPHQQQASASASGTGTASASGTAAVEDFMDFHAQVLEQERSKQQSQSPGHRKANVDSFFDQSHHNPQERENQEEASPEAARPQQQQQQGQGASGSTTTSSGSRSRSQPQEKPQQQQQGGNDLDDLFQ